MRRYAKRLAVITGGLFLVVLVGAGGFLLFLNSQAGARWVLGKITGAAAEAGWKMTAAEMTLDVFHRLHLKDVRMTRGEDHVALRELDVVYRIGLFPIAVEVERAILSGTDLKMHAKVTDPAKGDTAPAGGGLASTRSFLESPPAHLKVSKLSVTDVTFDYASEGPERSRVAARGSLAALEGALAAEPGRLVVDADLRDLVVAAWSFASPSATGDGSARLGAKARLLATKTDGRWLERLLVEKTNFSAGKMAGQYGEKHSSWRVGSVAMTLNGETAIGGPEALSIDRLIVEALSGEATVKASDVWVGPTKPVFASPAIDLVATGKRTEKVQVDLRGTVAKATVSAVKGPMQTNVTGLFEAPLDFKTLAFRGRGTVEGEPVAEGGFTATAGDPTQIESWGTLLLKAPFTRRVPAMAAVAGSEGVRGRFDFHGTAKTAMAHVLDVPRWADAPIESKFEGTLVPVGKRDPKLSAGSLTSTGTLTRDDGTWKLSGAVRTDRFVAGNAELREPILETQGQYTSDGSGTLVATAVLDGEKFFEARAAIEKDGAAKGEAKATFSPALAKRIPGDIGRWTLHASFATRPKGTTYAAEAAGELVQDAPSPSPLGPVRFTGPATWKLRGSYDVATGDTVGTFDAEVPAIDIEQFGRSGALRAQIALDAKGKPGRQDGTFVATIKQEDLRLKKSLAPGLPTLAGVQFETRAKVTGGGTRFTLDKLDASLGAGLVGLSGTAAGRIDRGSYQMGLKIFADVPKTFPIVKGMRLAGRAEMPLTINVGGGRDIDIDGDLLLTDVQWSNQDMALVGIGGRVPLQYQLVREGSRIRFAYLVTQNPFERVDYERLRPLLARAEQLRVDQVRFSDRRYGPIVGVLSMRQNLLFAHSFDASFGKSGSLGGEFFADLNPENLRVGLLSRLTALNLSEVLPTKSLVRVPSGKQTVSGRSGIVVDVRSGSASGRFDITEIGAPQLVTLINACDPTFENEKLNLARTALSFGHPTFVGARLERGYMDLAIDLKVVGTAQHFDVRGVPLSTFLASAFADARTNFAKEKVQ